MLSDEAAKNASNALHEHGWRVSGIKYGGKVTNYNHPKRPAHEIIQTRPDTFIHYNRDGVKNPHQQALAELPKYLAQAKSPLPQTQTSEAKKPPQISEDEEDTTQRAVKALKVPQKVPQDAASKALYAHGWKFSHRDGLTKTAYYRHPTRPDEGMAIARTPISLLKNQNISPFDIDPFGPKKPTFTHRRHYEHPDPGLPRPLAELPIYLARLPNISKKYLTQQREDRKAEQAYKNACNALQAHGWKVSSPSSRIFFHPKRPNAIITTRPNEGTFSHHDDQIKTRHQPLTELPKYLTEFHKSKDAYTSEVD